MATHVPTYNPTPGDVIDSKKATSLTQLHVNEAKAVALETLGSTDAQVIATLAQAIATNYRNIKMR
jgi:precorrin-6B methylase 1